MIERESQAQWRVRLYRQSASSRVPLSASIELLWSCNLRCQHCYLGKLRQRPDFLPLHFLYDTLQQLAGAGCLSLVITGGEPLLHPDFAAFYRRAVELGFFVSLFTNGSLVDERVADLFAQHPPHHVEVSLYGASPATYARLTGDAPAFGKMLRGVDLMRARGVDVRLKAVLLSGLLGDLAQMRQLAAERDLTLTLDPVVDGDFFGDTTGTSSRLSVATAVNIELGQSGRKQKMCQYDAQHSQQARQQNLGCGAAHSACHVDPRGFLMPCVMLREPALDLHKMGFDSAWALLQQADPVRHAADSPCAACEIQHLCNYCPGVASHVLGAGASSREYYCSIAQARAARLGQVNAQ